MVIWVRGAETAVARVRKGVGCELGGGGGEEESASFEAGLGRESCAWTCQSSYDPELLPITRSSYNAWRAVQAPTRRGDSRSPLLPTAPALLLPPPRPHSSSPASSTAPTIRPASSESAPPPSSPVHLPPTELLPLDRVDPLTRSSLAELRGGTHCSEGIPADTACC